MTTPHTQQTDGITHPIDRQPIVLVIQPDPLGTLDQFEQWLADARVGIRLVQPFAGHTVPSDIEEAGVIILGGAMSSLDDDQYSWLADIRALLLRAVDTEIPVLGICLGAQLLAQALGGEVLPGDQGYEAGLITSQLRPEGHSDPLFSGCGSSILAISLHTDMIARLPDNAVWLAQTPTYPHQAFRVGARAWGVQFHPEASGTTYRRWLTRARRTLDARTYEAVLSAANEGCPSNQTNFHAGRPIAQRFAEEVCRAATALPALPKPGCSAG